MVTDFIVFERLEVLLSTIITFTSFYRGHTLPSLFSQAQSIDREAKFNRWKSEGEQNDYDVNSLSDDS